MYKNTKVELLIIEKLSNLSEEEKNKIFNLILDMENENFKNEEKEMKESIKILKPLIEELKEKDKKLIEEIEKYKKDYKICSECIYGCGIGQEEKDDCSMYGICKYYNKDCDLEDLVI